MFERDGLMRVAAKAFDFEVAVPGIERVAERRGWLCRSLKAEHALIPRLARQPVGCLACFGRLFCGSPNRCAVNVFP